MARDKNISDLPRDEESPDIPAANGASELAERTAETAVVPGAAPNVSKGTRAVRIWDLSREASDRNLSVAATAVFPSEVTVALPPESPGPSVFSAGAALPPPGMEARMAKIKNISNQPLYLNLPGARTVKIPPRATTQLPHSDLDSPVVLFHLSRGTVIVVGRDEF